MMNKRKCRRFTGILTAISVMLMTLILLLPLYTSSMDIYMPDTAEISDPVTTETEPQTEMPETKADTEETMLTDPYGQYTKKPETTEKETFPSSVDYTNEMLIPMAILLLLAVSVFAVSCYLKYGRKR